jgi:hypothetical protein
MTKMITVTLTDAAAGTWTLAVPGKTSLATGERTPGYTQAVATGVTIPENQNYMQLADLLEPFIRTAFGSEPDAMVLCFNPNATDIGGQPDSDPVCQFRILDGNIEPQY